MSGCAFVDKESDDEDGKDDADYTDFVAIFVDLFKKLFFGFDTRDFGEIVADGGKYGIPNAGTQSGEEQKGTNLHTG